MREALAGKEGPETYTHSHQWILALRAEVRLLAMLLVRLGGLAGVVCVSRQKHFRALKPHVGRQGGDHLEALLCCHRG